MAHAQRTQGLSVSVNSSMCITIDLVRLNYVSFRSYNLFSNCSSFLPSPLCRQVFYSYGIGLFYILGGMLLTGTFLPAFLFWFQVGGVSSVPRACTLAHTCLGRDACTARSDCVAVSLVTMVQPQGVQTCFTAAAVWVQLWLREGGRVSQGHYRDISHYDRVI